MAACIAGGVGSFIAVPSVPAACLPRACGRGVAVGVAAGVAAGGWPRSSPSCQCLPCACRVGEWLWMWQAAGGWPHSIPWGTLLNVGCARVRAALCNYLRICQCARLSLALAMALPFRFPLFGSFSFLGQFGDT